MRPVQLSDIEAAARVLLYSDPAHRRQVASKLIRQAGLADRYRKRLGRIHPGFGSGTLMSAAMTHKHGPRPAACGPDYLYCIALVAVELLAASGDQNP